MILGKRIRFFREEKEFTQLQLAEKANISSKAVGRYENDNRVPSVEIAQRIATALGVSVNELLYSDTANESPDSNKDKNLVDKLDLDELQAKLDERSKKLEIIIKNFDKLNESGHQEIVDYVIALTRIPKYKKQSKNDGTRAL